MNSVVYYGNMNTFTILCLGMTVIVLFEMLFSFEREFLINVITARVDTRISEFMFDKVLRLPIDYFERTRVGIIGHDMNEVIKIREFMTGQLFGTVLDSMMLFVFVPVMCYFSILLTSIVLTFCVLIALWLIIMLPASRRAAKAVIEAEGERGALLYETIQGMRTIKSLGLEPRQRKEWDREITKAAKLKVHDGFIRGVILTGVRPMERLAVSAPFALGIYLALSTGDVSWSVTLAGFLMLSMRIAGPLMQIAMLVSQYDEARAAVSLVAALVNQPKEEGATDHGVRSALSGRIEFVNLRFKYRGATNFALDGVSFEVPIGQTIGVVGRSGSGKTTIARLLQRLHSDYDGLIKMASTCGSMTSRTSVGASALCCRRIFFSAAQFGTIFVLPNRTRVLMRSCAPRAWPERRNSSRGSQGDMAPSFMRAPPISRAASGSVWRSPAR
jgi:ATP-binding cassette subfamily B protein